MLSVFAQTFMVATQTEARNEPKKRLKDDPWWKVSLRVTTARPK
jgi:hypothetical protein